MQPRFALLFAVLSTTVACVAQTEGPAASNASPLDECDGEYVCTSPSYSAKMNVTLHRSTEGCSWGRATLLPDGSILPAGSWKGTAASFQGS